MTLVELIKPELVLTNTLCTSKNDLINSIVEKIYSAGMGLPVSQDVLLQSIFMREQIGGTFLPSGLSVPHARLKDFEGFIMAFGTTKEPLFHEGTQLRLMAMMISSQSGGPYYLPAVAALTKISRDSEFLSLLSAAENAEGFIRLMKEKDQQLT
jgi:PTS system nitrogen regulatory IIA component